MIASSGKSGAAEDGLFPPPGHNHGTCVKHALARARVVCAERSIKFTDLREQVFRVIVSSHKALGAYDIIEMLAVDGRRLAPISVYRVIEVLAKAGLVHRLESRQAFFACLSKHEGMASPLVLLCEGCGCVAEAEAPEAWGTIVGAAGRAGFAVSDSVLEIRGRCANCQAEGVPA
jgi:Fur family zinc uptake transcriptional regulator